MRSHLEAIRLALESRISSYTITLSLPLTRMSLFQGMALQRAQVSVSFSFSSSIGLSCLLAGASAPASVALAAAPSSGRRPAPLPYQHPCQHMGNIRKELREDSSWKEKRRRLTASAVPFSSCFCSSLFFLLLLLAFHACGHTHVNSTLRLHFRFRKNRAILFTVCIVSLAQHSKLLRSFDTNS